MTRDVHVIGGRKAGPTHMGDDTSTALATALEENEDNPTTQTLIERVWTTYAFVDEFPKRPPTGKDISVTILKIQTCPHALGRSLTSRF